MRVRSITTCALGLAAALTFGRSLAAQQDSTKLRKTTTSSTRIPISKESPGEVVTVRVDTVYVTRHDTVTSTILRIDTVVVTPPAPVIIPKIRNNMYWGVYAGATEPWGNIDRMYTNGFHGGGVLGWESQESMFGLRLNGDMAQINREQGRNDAVVGVGTPLLLTLGADLKVKPLSFGGWDLYGLLGGNFNSYKRIATVGSDNCISAINGISVDGKGGCYVPASQDWKSKFGFNLGAGTDFHIGSQDMFIEARYVALSNDGARTWFLPISLGVRYF